MKKIYAFLVALLFATPVLAQEGGSQVVEVSGTAALSTQLSSGWKLIQCTTAAHYRIGPSTVVATTDDLELPRDTIRSVYVEPGAPYISFVTDSAEGDCRISHSSVPGPNGSVSGSGAGGGGGELFNVESYGADGSDSASDQSAIEDALTDACAASPVGRVYLPRGHYYQTRPLYGCDNVSFFGDGTGQTIIEYLGSGATAVGYNLILGSDHSATGLDDAMDQWIAPLVGVTGSSFQQRAGGVASGVFLDLNQYYGLRLPAAGWTMRFFLKLDDTPSDGDTLIQCAGQIFGGANADDEFGTEYTVSPVCFSLAIDSNRVMKWSIRRDGTSSLPMTIETASIPTGALTVGNTYHVQISYNDTGDCMEAFIDGEEWTRGCQSPGASADGSGFFQRPWERIVIGDESGGQFPAYTETNAHAQATIFSLQFLTGELNNATFTPPAVAHTAGATNLLLLNGTSFYKDHVVGEGAANGSQLAYLRMMGVANETAGTYVHDLAFYYGYGIYGEFNSSSKYENVLHFACSDGWFFANNNYFSEFENIDLVACNGARFGLAFNGGSYIGLRDVQVAAGGIGIALNSSNVTGNNVSITMHPGYFVGLASVGVGGTQIWNGLQLDAEEANTSELAALALEDPQSFTCTGCSLYLQSDTATPVTINHISGADTTHPPAIAFNQPTIFTSAATPWLRTIGTLTSFVNPIIVNNPNLWQASPLITGAKQGLIADSSKIRRQQVAGITTDNAAVLAIPTDPVRESDYIVSATSLVTVYGAGNVGAEVVYTDCGGTSRTLPLPGFTTAGALATVVTSATVLNGTPMKICADPATTITIQSVNSTPDATVTIQGAAQRVSP